MDSSSSSPGGAAFACTNHPTVAVGTACNKCRRPFCPDCLVPLRGEWLCDGCKHATLRGYFRVYTLAPGTTPSSSLAGGTGVGAHGAPAVPAPTTPGAPISFVSAVPEAATAAPEMSAAAPADGAVRCSLHTNRVAEEACERCGDFMCPLCSTCYEGRFYCLRCFDLLWQRGELRGAGGGKDAANTSSSPAVGLVLALLSWPFLLCTGFNWLLAAVSAVLAIRYLRSTADDPAAKSRGLAVATLVVAGISAVLSLLISLGVFNR